MRSRYSVLRVIALLPGYHAKLFRPRPERCASCHRHKWQRCGGVWRVAWWSWWDSCRHMPSHKKHLAEELELVDLSIPSSLIHNDKSLLQQPLTFSQQGQSHRYQQPARCNAQPEHLEQSEGCSGRTNDHTLLHRSGFASGWQKKTHWSSHRRLSLTMWRNSCEKLERREKKQIFVLMKSK